MKITPNNYRPTLTDSLGNSKKNNDLNSGAQSQSNSTSVDFSPAARQLQQLNSDQNDINLDRVTRLRTALANGTLTIDTSRIADRLISSARDLLK